MLQADILPAHFNIEYTLLYLITPTKKFKSGSKLHTIYSQNLGLKFLLNNFSPDSKSIIIQAGQYPIERILFNGQIQEFSIDNQHQIIVQLPDQIESNELSCRNLLEIQFVVPCLDSNLSIVQTNLPQLNGHPMCNINEFKIQTK
jgi:hypothetical protein